MSGLSHSHNVILTYFWHFVDIYIMLHQIGIDFEMNGISQTILQ